MVKRVLVVLGVGAATLCVMFGVSPAPETEAQVADGCSAVFDYSGRASSFIVPPGITQVELDVFGAAGGDATSSAQNIGEGGFGAGVSNAILTVAAGDRLTVIVGGEGGPADSGGGGSQRIDGGVGGFGYDGTADGGRSGGQGGDATGYHGGGGGGGASAVLRNDTPVIAAGGGGGGAHGGVGGDGGTNGANGTSVGTGPSNEFGLGATPTAGGAGGAGDHGGANGATGVQGAGGTGGAALNTSGGQSSPGGDAGGGGGGGIFGGGGAGGSAASNSGGGAGGGGGSSLTTIGTIEDGIRDGDGRIDITLSDDDCPGDLEIEKTVSDARPEIGDRITYTLAVTNNGPVDPDRNVVVTDNLPPEVRYVSDDCGGRNRPPWTWNVGTLGRGDTERCRITVEVVEAGTDIPNTASVSGANLDRNPGNNEDTVTITVPRPDFDLELVKRAVPRAVFVGNRVVYALTVSNLGPDRAASATVVDILPPEVAYVSDTCDGFLPAVSPPELDLPFDLPAGTIWVWRLGELPNRRTVTCLITVEVLQPGTAIRNVAAVVPHGREGGLRLANNLDDATIAAYLRTGPSPPPADLAIAKTGPATVKQGARFSWTMTVTNNGPEPATNVEAVDQIPAAIVRPATSTPGCAIATRTLTCTIGELAAGASTRIVVSGRAPLKSGCVSNSALVTGDQIDSTETNNHDSARVCARAPELRLAKTASRSVVGPGELLSYRIVVRNVGGGPAREVRVCDRPSADLEIVAAPGSTEISKRRACWEVRLLREGGKRTFAVIARVLPGAEPGVKPNAATASASNVRGVKRSIARVRVQPGACAASAVAALC